MIRRLLVLAVAASLGCSGRSGQPVPLPQSMSETLTRFLAAVKANDLNRMGDLWGTERGPATEWMAAEVLRRRLTVIQKYLSHTGYRVVEGPLTPPGQGSALRTYRVELQREGCNRVVPIDLVQTRRGGWIVYDVHLESAGNPGVACQPGSGGTAGTGGMGTRS